MTAEIINFFRKKEDIWRCALCNKYVKRNNKHVILEIHTLPTGLLIFHLFHYKDFLETLKNYFLNKDHNKFNMFMEKPINDINEKQKIAYIEGLAKEFGEDMKDIKNFIMFKLIKHTIKAEISCILTKEKITIKQCFACKVDKSLICNEGIFFSVRPENESLKIKRGC